MPKPATRVEFCMATPGCIKWLAIIIASIILALLLWDFRDPGALPPGEQYVVFCGAFTIGFCLLILIIFFCGLYQSLRCLDLISWIFLVLALLWLAAGGVQTWITYIHRDYGSRYVGQRAAAAALAYLNGLLFLGGMQQTRVVELYAAHNV